MGWGFRLITLLRSGILYVCFLGPHDECDRWLAENSRIKEVGFGRSTLCQAASQELREEVVSPEGACEMLDDLDKRLQELPDQSLRRIFYGLVEARKKSLASRSRPEGKLFSRR